ncbi:MAG TPA: hypothetical protein VNY35_07760 [Solirubrobacteraceae bacterium]|nr:hypothetical protein [Solirubrobacteraceae bacterium]
MSNDLPVSEAGAAPEEEPAEDRWLDAGGAALGVDGWGGFAGGACAAGSGEAAAGGVGEVGGAGATIARPSSTGVWVAGW